MNLFDVIIIGGGPTGSTAATLLAEKGHSVLVLEKEKFPREHVGESLIPHTYHCLKRLGVLAEMEKIATRKPGVNFTSADGKHQSLWCFNKLLKNESYLTYHVIRSAFDKLLFDNSKKKGAKVQEETIVKDVTLDNPDGSVVVTVVGKDGIKREIRAKFLIDASGQSTVLGKKLGVKRSYKELDRVAIFNHWTNTNFDASLKEGVIKIVYLGGEKKGWAWVIPVSRDHLSIGVVINNAYVKQEKEKLEKNGSLNWEKDLYIQELSYSSALGKILKDAKLEHRTLTAGNYSYYCENKYGANYAIVGDAAAFLDPIFSSGIHVGMHSSELVAEAVHAKLINGNYNIEIREAYAKINGAVNVLEKFIRLFYTPEALNFSSLGNPEEMLYNKYEKAYSIFHYLLAGDFFSKHEQYSHFLDLVRNEKMLAKFEALIDHKKYDAPDSVCGETFEDMYGKMVHEIRFDKSIL